MAERLLSFLCLVIAMSLYPCVNAGKLKNTLQVCICIFHLHKTYYLLFHIACVCFNIGKALT